MIETTLSYVGPSTELFIGQGGEVDIGAVSTSLECSFTVETVFGGSLLIEVNPPSLISDTPNNALEIGDDNKLYVGPMSWGLSQW